MAAPANDPTVLFDLDDTLVPWQTVTHWQWAWRPNGPLVPERHALAAIKRSVRSWDRRRWQGFVGALTPAGPAEYRQFLRATLTEVAGHSLPPAEVEAVVDRFLRAAGEIERFPDATATLTQLLGRGHRVGIVSELPPETARSLLKRSGIDERLLVLADDGSEANRLPSVAAFRTACERLGSKPSRSLFVGDLYWSDVRASHRAGLERVLVDRYDIWPRVAEARIRSLSELFALPYFHRAPPPTTPPGPPPTGPPPGSAPPPPSA